MNTYSIHEKAHAYAHTKPRLTEFVFSAPKIVLTPVSKHPHPLHTDPQPKLNQYPHTTRPRKNRQLLPVDERFWRHSSMFLRYQGNYRDPHQRLDADFIYSLIFGYISLYRALSTGKFRAANSFLKSFPNAACNAATTYVLCSVADTPSS